MFNNNNNNNTEMKVYYGEKEKDCMSHAVSFNPFQDKQHTEPCKYIVFQKIIVNQIITVLLKKKKKKNKREREYNFYEFF